MLDNIKHLLSLKSVDKNIAENNFDLALEKLNSLIKEGYNPAVTFLKRGKLCKKLLMLNEAYSDFTYIIGNCADKKAAYYERLKLNFEITNYKGALLDAETILGWDPDNFEVKKYKFLSLVYSGENEIAKEYILNLFGHNKFKTLHFIFNESALILANDEYSNGLKLLDIIELIDKNNPVKLLKEATVYGLAGEKEKEAEILKKIDNTFPKYFITHFKFYDMYQEKDLLEICFLLEMAVFDKQNFFSYFMKILEGYKNHIEGHIIDSKECFEKAIEINPKKPEAYVLLAQTLQLISGYDNPQFKKAAEDNYKKALEIYLNANLAVKAEDMKRQIKHLNSSIVLK